MAALEIYSPERTISPQTRQLKHDNQQHNQQHNQQLNQQLNGSPRRKETQQHPSSCLQGTPTRSSAPTYNGDGP
eukprot:scaffold9386_cov87-Skeletonema_menzelii.AAC.2